MEKRLYTTVAILGVILLFLSLQILSVHTQTTASENPIDISEEVPESLDMLLFISPQYSKDIEILDAVNNYIESVQKDIGWNSEIIPVTTEENDYLKIDLIIEHYYNSYDLKACIMVGEDINTPLAGDSDYQEKPSTIPWSTIGGPQVYDSSDQGVVCKPYTTKLCISLLFPTQTLDFQTKKSQLISAFKKFSERRHDFELEKVLVAESSDINVNSKDIYQNIDANTDLIYLENPTDSEIFSFTKSPYSIFLIHGHSNPSGTLINRENVWFSANNVDELNTPIFGADGCYVNGWWSQCQDNDKLDSSINGTYYATKIFSSENIRVMALGLLSQNGYSYPVSFIENSLPDILEGKTVAESIINKNCLGDTVIIGDPTFHFTQ